MEIRLRGGNQFRVAWLGSVISLGLIVLLLAGCSSGGGNSGGTNITLGLAGSTADHPAPPPTIAANGPTDIYAFVYDNQIWVHQSNAATATKITGLVLSNGADIIWGPLVWSPDHKKIAFALVQNLTPTTPSASSGPIYIVDVASGAVIVTPGIGSIYGHAYTWYGSHMLFYSSGDGISMYDVGDPDPRVWPVISSFTQQNNQTFSNNVVFGDIALTNNDNLYYSAAQISSLGSTGTVGSAAVYKASLPSLSTYNGVYSSNVQNSPNSIPIWLNGVFPLQSAGYQVHDLGKAYSDAAGITTLGAWQVSSGESQLVRQVIDSVDTHAHTVSSHFCTSGGCSGVLSGVSAYAQSIHGQLSLSSDGKHIAFTTDTLYTQATSGGTVNKLASVGGWAVPPAMTHNGSLTIVTQVVSSSTDSTGVLRIKTNLVAFDGQNQNVLIAGAQNAAWQ